MVRYFFEERREGRSSMDLKLRMGGMHDRKHRHTMKLMEYNHGRDGDVCIRCEKGILCKSSVYTCGNPTSSPEAEEQKCAFFFHQNCASPRLFMHPKDKDFLSLVSSKNSLFCKVCDLPTGDYLYCSGECESHFCMKCPVVDGGLKMIQHWSHQHPLRLVERYATFECDACNKMATDYSYMCDIDCPFWIHKSCAILPQTRSFGIHSKHPLTLSDSLPKIYCKFQQFCKICKAQVHPRRWLYYCGSCRFFAHVQCALSKNQVIRQEDCFDDPMLMHLPAPDEPSMNFIMENCIKDMISLLENTGTAPPHRINHWSHQHALSLKSRCGIFTTDEHLNQDLERQIICDGCTKPISSSSDDTEVFYECSQCNYSLHRYCAQFPQVMQHQVIGMLKGLQPSIIRNDTFQCYCCKVHSNGLQMFQPERRFSLDVWCASLPKKIKHQVHHHPLENQKLPHAQICEACLDHIPSSSPFVFGCTSCGFYLHVNCLLKPATIKHRWDPHPLHLVRSVEDDVEDHPHEFECEFCSEEIDTNTWFYHCSICDLSFHLNYCINPYNDYSNVKLGATNIKNKAHQHDLTLVLNKNKKRPPCGSCSKYTKGALITECKPCNFVLHSDCKDEGAFHRRDILNRIGAPRILDGFAFD